LANEPEAEKRRLTSTSYAILGYMAIGEFSTFAIAKQMRRNAQHFWPRAKSNLYAEPKRLLEGGFAEARAESVGDRPRTIYSITEKGREALAAWLGQPPAPARLESEMLVKMLFAPYGSKEDLVASLRAFREQVGEKEEELLAIFRQYVAGEDPYPDRVHVNVLMFKLIWDYAQAESRWADWAIPIAEGWPDVVGPHDRKELISVLEQIVAEADESR
jgi:DNA-binding PadR family transcriptional regulator